MYWKIIRRVLMGLALSVAVVCVILLLNFTASNPTGRRYSSAEPSATGSNIVTSKHAGIEAETILGRDLSLPLNSRLHSQSCVCDHTKHDLCGACLAHIDLPGTQDYYVPDFVGKKFIAEAKHTHSTDSLNYYQELAFSMAAKSTNQEFWLFVDVDAEIDQRYIDMAESTGGDVVYYFTVPGYVDPVDRAAWIGLAISTATGSGAALLELRSRRPARVIPRLRLNPSRPTPVDDAVAFRDRIKRRAQRLIDKENSR